MQNLDFILFFIPAESWVRFGFALKDCARWASQGPAYAAHVHLDRCRWINQHFYKKKA